MAAESSFEHLYVGTEPQQPMQPPVLMPQPSPEQLASKQPDRLATLTEYCRDKLGINLEQMEAKDKPAITEAAHIVIADLVDHEIIQVKESAEEHIRAGGSPETAPKPPYRVPFAPVEARASFYYDEFGIKRRDKSEPLLRSELRYLQENIKPAFAMTYRGGDIGADGMETPRKAYPRALDFLELGYTIQLIKELREKDATLAADSLEVLLAAYGGWFPQRVHSAGRNILRVNENSNRIKYIDQDSIPEEQRAENWQAK